MDVMSARELQLVFSVGVCTVIVYTVGLWGRSIHRGKVCEDTVGFKILRWGCCLGRSGFGRGSMAKKAAKKG